MTSGLNCLPFNLLLIGIMLCNQLTYASGETELNAYQQELMELLIKGRQFESINFDTAISYYTKAELLARSHQDSTGVAKVKENIGFAYYYGGKSQLAPGFLLEAIDIYTSTTDTISVINSCYNLGFIYEGLEDYPAAIDVLKKSEELALIKGDESILGRIFNNLGLIYQYVGLYDHANEYQFKALRQKEKTRDTTISLTHVNIALNYSQNAKFNESLRHLDLATSLFDPDTQLKELAHVIKNKGDVFQEMGKVDSAQACYIKAIQYYRELNDPVSLSRCRMALGNLFVSLEDFEMAEYYLNQSLDSLPQNASVKLRCYIFKSLSELYLLKYEYFQGNQSLYLDKAFSFAQRLYTECDRVGSLEIKRAGLRLLYQIYGYKGESKKALAFAQEYIELNDTMFSMEKQQNINEIQTRYETEKKELTIQLLNSENERISDNLTQSQSIRNAQRFIIILLVVGIILIAGILILTYRYYKLLQKNNNKLRVQSALISSQKTEIELLIREMNHRVKNNLQIIISLLNLQMNQSSDKVVNEALLDGLSRIQSVGIIHELLYRSKDQVNLNFKNFVQELCKHLSQIVTHNNNVIHLAIESDVAFKVDTTVSLGIILNELLTNSIKYACEQQDDCRIDISLEKLENDRFQLIVQDNGSGFPPSFKRESVNSLGLSLVDTLVAQLNGEITLKNNKGALILITFSSPKE